MEIKFFNSELESLFKPQTELSAGYDLRSMIDVVVYPNETTIIPTGVAVHMNNPGLCAIIMPRSGLGCRGIRPRNTPGLIDADYQGEIIVCLHNSSEDPVAIKKLDRIAQLVFMPVYHPQFELVEEFSDNSLRGTGGLGSTGMG